MFKHPITVQTYTLGFDEIGNNIETWVDLIKCRAQINGIGGKEYYQAAQINATNDMSFEVRYCNALSQITPQNARIIYKGDIYNIKHLDDFMQEHRTIKMRCIKNA